MYKLINEQNQHNESPFGKYFSSYLAEEGRCDDIIELLENGYISYSDYNFQSGQKTPFHDNIQSQDMIEFAIKTGFDLNTQDNKGQTLLHLAVYEGFLNIATMLIEAGARTDIKDDNSETVEDFLISEEIVL